MRTVALLLLAASALFAQTTVVGGSGLPANCSDGGGDIVCTGAITASSFVGSGTTAGEISLYELPANGTNYRSWLVPDSLTVSLTFSLPDAVPAAGDVMKFSAPAAGVSNVTFGYPVPDATYWDTGSGGNSGGWTLAGANQIRAYCVYINTPVAFSAINYIVQTADTTGCAGSPCVYDVCLYDSGGALKANIGATELLTTGTKAGAVTATRINPGVYCIAFTGTGTGGKIGFTNSTIYWAHAVNAVLTESSSGGVCPASVTLPALAPVGAQQLVSIALGN